MSAVPATRALTVAVGDGSVSALLVTPDAAPRCGYVLAHGAGAGMAHPFLEALAAALGQRGVATLRYQFPFMEQGKKRVDPPAVAVATVRAAVAAAREHLGDVPLVAGGKSFGGRMTSTAQAEEPLPGVGGLAFLGFPLHAAGRPSVARAAHLASIAVPMLFVQGTRDALADRALIAEFTSSLPRAAVHWIDDGDHSFAVRKSVTGRGAAAVMDEIADAVAAFVNAVAGGSRPSSRPGPR